MNRSYNTVEDFALDPTFRSWVFDNEKKARLAWEKFLSQNPGKKALVQEAKEFLWELAELDSLSIETSLTNQAKEKLWRKIKSNLPEESGRVSAPAFGLDLSGRSIPIQKKTRPLYYFLLAACLVSFLIASGVYYSTISPPEVTEPTEIAWLTNSTQPGVKSSAKLPDGSVVFLNSGSSIRYRKGLEGEIREIFLEGEAFFEVKRDTLRPFLVHSRNLSTQALGTSFNIRNFREKPLEITLVTGKAKVESEDQSSLQVLNPGEGVYESEGTWVKSQVNLENATAWMNKTIVFESEEFLDAIGELENWFGVEITLTHLPQKPASISAKYVNESLENILYGLSYKMDFAYEIKGNQVEINFNPKK